MKLRGEEPLEAGDGVAEVGGEGDVLAEVAGTAGGERVIQRRRHRIHIR